MTVTCECGALLDAGAAPGTLCGGAVCWSAPPPAGVLCTCTLCGRVYVGTVDEVSARVRRCKYHPDRASAYGYRFIEAAASPAAGAAAVGLVGDLLPRGELVEDERG